MAKEIEHKYMVVSSQYIDMATRSYYIAQGYLNRDPMRTVRVRIKDDKAFLTIKSKNMGDTRQEYEYPVPVEDAQEMLRLCEGRVIAKRRYIVPFEGMTWEVDAFEGNLYPLIVAEIELQDSDQVYALPPFVGRNVTDDERFYNSRLASDGVDVAQLMKLS
ncbi:MAG: CYTH domain-containing protein [Muribaculaceae bacterium]|nr:CYTH domain-containing protein [Muribaculaceae bacterium]